MNCKKSRKLLPLILGNELSERKVEKIKKHIENCEKCRREFLEYQSVLRKIKDISRDEEVNWDDREWTALVKKATSQNIEKKSSISILLTRPAFLTLGLILFVSFALIFFARDWINKKEIQTVKKSEVTAKLEKGEIKPSREERIEPVREKGLSRNELQAKKRRMIAKRKVQSVKMEKKTEPEQTMISMTIVSEETGLKIVWFFNKNFEWEE